MAPSPTGNLHIGTAYATMWPYLFARSQGGEFLLRIEDTDRERSTKEFEENIVEGLKWLQFEWDEFYHQMDRLEVYQKYSDRLVKEGKAYYCFCTREELEIVRKRQIESGKAQIYSGKCRNLSVEEVEQKRQEVKDYVVRFKLPEDRGVVEFEDLVHGKISFESSLIGDMVIMRASGIPLYNFAVVVDDVEMKITHVIRGDDHISNTPKQILIFEALGVELPVFGHTPMILNQDRMGKLSKRTGSTSVEEFINDGYLPEVMFNYIALLGWSPKETREIFSREELIKKFDIKDMNKSAAAWNQDKLDSINGEYIRAMSDEELSGRLKEFYKGILGTEEDKKKIEQVTPIVKERMKTLRDFELLTSFIFERVEYEKSVFFSLKIDNIKVVLGKVLEKFEGLKKPWEREEFETVFQGLAKELGLSNTQMFQLIRVLISGQLVTPPLFESMQILGEEEVLDRVRKGVGFLI